MPSGPSSRLAYIDWLRGLACVLMFQTHCYDAWLGGDARTSKLFMWSQILGTFPAPLFLFLAGMSFAMVNEKLIRSGLNANQIARITIRRGAQIFALGLLFRIQEFVIAWGWAPWSDLFRVDILNNIGVSLMLMGTICWVVETSSPHNSRSSLVLVAISAAAGISALTPLLWTSWRPRFLPWPVESYIDGVHNLGAPQPWLFPIFPWAAFAFAGLACGFLLTSDSAKRLEWRVFLLAGGAGVVLIGCGKLFDSGAFQLYRVYDFWHTSPNFFMIRLGLLFLMILAVYVWCRWGLAQRGFSPMIQLGQTSLLVYWVHIEFVYGRFHILQPRGQRIAGASAGLIAIFLAMLMLSVLRTRWKMPSRQLLPSTTIPKMN